jgi:hypothetical protein
MNSNFKRKFDEVTDEPIMLWVAVILLVFLLAFGMKIIADNIIPYMALTDAPTLRHSHVPILGWGIDFITILYLGTGAFILWFLIQISQVIWILIALDRKAQRFAIYQGQEEVRHQGASGYDENRIIRQAKRRAVAIPFFFISYSGYIALAGFIAEFIINVRYYPVVENWSRFTAGLTIGQITGLNVPGLMTLCWNMFSTEMLIVMIVILCQWIYAHKRG